MVNVVWMLIEVLVGYGFLIFGINYRTVPVLGSIISKIIMLMLIKGVKFIKKNRKESNMPTKYWVRLFMVPMGSIFVVHTLFILSQEVNNNKILLLSSISSILILLINIIVFFVYEKLAEKIEIEKQNMIFQKQIELCEKQIEEWEEGNINIRNLRHDMKNHFLYLKDCILRMEYEGLNNYLESILENSGLTNEEKIAASGNMVVDSLLNYKYSMAIRQRIKINIQLEIPNKFRFLEGDICIILGNLIDNAVEAVSKLSEDKRQINVALVYRQDILIINISNPYEGLLSKDKGGHILSIKKNSENHGIGLKSIERAVRKYNGMIKIETKNNVFINNILLYSMK